MNETLNYIESYFENGLTTEERMQFEQRITADAAFASEVAFYVQARQVLRQELIQEKEKSWESAPALQAITTAPVIPIKRPSLVKRWIAVAAGVIVVLGISLTFLLSNSGSAVQLAKNYSDSAFEKLSLTMDASRDSLQQGIAAYNAGKWDEAENIFNAVYAAHPDTLDALKYSGIVSLKKKNFDTAINKFEKLADYKNVFANPGLFYQALALLLRNKDGDKQQARILLQAVINNNLFGKPEAIRIFKKIPS